MSPVGGALVAPLFRRGTPWGFMLERGVGCPRCEELGARKRGSSWESPGFEPPVKIPVGPSQRGRLACLAEILGLH